MAFKLCCCVYYRLYIRKPQAYNYRHHSGVNNHGEERESGCYGGKWPKIECILFPLTGRICIYEIRHV